MVCADVGESGAEAGELEKGYTDDEVTVYRGLRPATMRIELPYILGQSTHLKNEFTSVSVTFAKPVCASISGVGNATTGIRGVGVVGGAKTRTRFNTGTSVDERGGRVVQGHSISEPVV